MTKSKLSRWVKRSAFAVIVCATFAMVSAEQAQAQYYGGRGFNRGGLSINIGRGGFSYGNFGGGGFNRGYGGYGGYGGFNNFNSGYRYVPQRSYYRGGGGYYGGGYGRGYNSYSRRY